jgi:hypothetical protein
MTPDAARELLEQVTLEWVADPESEAVWAGEHETRWGIRLRQQAREATTIWFDVGELTVQFEAYLLPAPPRQPAEVYRQSLRRNLTAWPAAIALDPDGDLIIVGRIPISGLSRSEIDRAVGAVYELVELSFPALIRAGFGSREKSG